MLTSRLLLEHNICWCNCWCCGCCCSLLTDHRDASLRSLGVNHGERVCLCLCACACTQSSSPCTPGLCRYPGQLLQLGAPTHCFTGCSDSAVVIRRYRWWTSHNAEHPCCSTTRQQAPPHLKDCRQRMCHHQHHMSVHKPSGVVWCPVL